MILRSLNIGLLNISLFETERKLIFNFLLNRNWKKLTDSRKRANFLADNRKYNHLIETLMKILHGSCLKKGS